METQFELIRVALAERATDEERMAGAEACRQILALLVPPPIAPATPSIPAIVTALRTVPAEQLLEFAIGKLQAAVTGRGLEVDKPRPLAFQLLPLPRVSP